MRPDFSRFTRLTEEDISLKVNKVLHVFLISLILIGLRLWVLAVPNREEMVKLAKKPMLKTVIEPARRGTIRDRFNTPLAINRLRYQAAIVYSQIKEIPQTVSQIDEKGDRVKIFKRRTYIETLSKKLGEILSLDEKRIEDLIHSKGAFFEHIPFVIKEDLSEKEYYTLKMMERDWPGVVVQKIPKRVYPEGKVASDVIGYIGAINKSEYEKIIFEMKALRGLLSDPEEFLRKEEIESRLIDLEERAYSLKDSVGKMGVEAQFEERLRGYFGKKKYYRDAKGHLLYEVEGGREALSGDRLILTLSLELQKFTEELLIQNETIRKGKISGMSAIKQELLSLKDPWIKGGAIVVMDPKNGDILAIATHPRFDPNDFILTGSKETIKKKVKQIQKWFETEEYFANLFDQKIPFEKEIFDGKRITEMKQLITWDTYLDLLLPPFDEEGQTHPVRKAFESSNTVEAAYLIQKTVDELLLASGQTDPELLFQALFDEGLSFEIKETLLENISFSLPSFEEKVNFLRSIFSPLKRDDNRVLFLDLCRLAVCKDLLEESLISKIGKQLLSDYRNTSASYGIFYDEVKEIYKTLFHQEFEKWREREGKEFLKAKRLLEKEQKVFAKPYLDYFDQEEKRQFSEFWSTYGVIELVSLLKNEKELPLKSKKHFEKVKTSVQNLTHEEVICYIKSLRGYKDLTRPLLGRYRFLRGSLEKDLAIGFYPRFGFGYGRSFAYRQSTHQGSLFKLVTAYEALIQKHQRLINEGIPQKSLNSALLNPLEMIDLFRKTAKGVQVGSFTDGSPLPQIYKGGRIPKSALKEIGRVDLLKALEVSSNPYFAVLAGDIIESPDDLTRAASLFSYGEKTGLDLPYEIKGKLPNDLGKNKTGLYSFAIGHHTFVATPIQTAVMLSTIANGGHVLKPKLIKCLAGPEGVQDPKKSLRIQETTCRFNIFMPEIVRKILLKGMKGVWQRTQVEGLSGLKVIFAKHPKIIKNFLALKDDFVGKTSTSESVEVVNIDKALGVHKFNHTWFGGISFKGREGIPGLVSEDSFGDPELVVVVYLRFGEWGKDAAPLASEIVHKWRSIQSGLPLK